MDTSEKLSHISLCFGYGGIDLGLHRVYGERMQLAAVCEIEAAAVENALAKMEAGLLPPAPVWNDLRTFPWEHFVGVDLVSGGFPCQPFSAPGLRGADNDPRHLFPSILEGIKICKPAVVFLENVEGIITAKLSKSGRDPEGTPVLLHVLRELERVGYSATAGIFDAATEGAPHQRKRVFIMAHCNDTGLQGDLEKFTIQEGWEMPVRPPSGGGQSSCGRTTEEMAQTKEAIDTREPWPARPGKPQHNWEPPRQISGGRTKNKSSLGGSIDGIADGVDEFGSSGQSDCSVEEVRSWMTKVDNYCEEIRMLGNGCVPHTVERAWRELFAELHELPPR